MHTVALTSPEQVSQLLNRAKGRRAVAATLMNERSSRSHSVFSLRVSSSNSFTGEACEVSRKTTHPLILAAAPCALASSAYKPLFSTLR